MIEEVIQQNNSMMCIELSGYLEESFGNPVRIDYGTGHETTFIVFLCKIFSLKLPHSCIDCLYQLGLINDSDLKAVVLRIFTGYLAVCRHLQRMYMLEPAGSHGVWSLDDYQMLVFYFGGCQLHGNPLYSPDCICDRGLMVEQASEYMYFEAIHFINTVRQYYFIKLIIQ